METPTVVPGMFIRAVSFAAHKHRNQRRKNLESPPYINHPIALADLLANEAGINSLIVLCAAILHDTIEDTETSESELRSIFGVAVAEIVLEVTDDKSLLKEERKHKQIERARNCSHEAKLVKLADKICNLRDILASPPAGWSLERKQAYFDWAGNVIDGVRGSHSGLEEIFDSLLGRRSELA